MLANLSRSDERSFALRRLDWDLGFVKAVVVISTYQRRTILVSRHGGMKNIGARRQVAKPSHNHRSERRLDGWLISNCELEVDSIMTGKLKSLGGAEGTCD
jgi:hypothetical protein